MCDIMINHLLTILLKPGINGLASRIINESDGIKNHKVAFKDIEKRLNHEYRIPYISREIDDLIDMIHRHLEFGNTVICNMSIDKKLVFMIYMPENINELDKDIIKDVIKELSGIDQLFLYQQVGEKHKIIDTDDFLQNKQKKLTMNLQNMNKSK